MANIKVQPLDLTAEGWTTINADYHGVRFINHGAAVGCIYVEGPVEHSYKVVRHGAEVSEPFVFAHVFHIDGWTHAVVEKLAEPLLGRRYAFRGEEVHIGVDLANGSDQTVPPHPADIALDNAIKEADKDAATEHAKAVAEAQALAEGLNLDGSPATGGEK